MLSKQNFRQLFVLQFICVQGFTLAVGDQSMANDASIN